MVQDVVNGDFTLGWNIGENLLQFMAELIFVYITVLVERFDKSTIQNVGE